MVAETLGWLIPTVIGGVAGFMIGTLFATSREAPSGPPPPRKETRPPGTKRILVHDDSHGVMVENEQRKKHALGR